jgi:hypothetical protein
MATVSNVGLSIQDGKTADTRKVTVSYGLTFAPAEIGLPYELSIDLLGEDAPGDDEAPNGSSSTPIYSFGFPLIRHKDVVGSSGSARVQPETREIGRQTLDEDPGTTHVEFNGLDLQLPHHDEVFARVTLVSRPATGRSPIVKLF